MWGVRGRALSHPRPLVFSGVRPGPTTHWLWMRGVRVWGPVTNPKARALACSGGGMRVPGGAPLAWVWGVRARALSHPRQRLELPLTVCHAFRAFSALCVLPLKLPLELPPCALHLLHVLHIRRDRLWTWVQDEGTTESSDEEGSEEESEEEAEEAEEKDEQDEDGSDAASVKDEDEPSLAQRAPRSTNLEVARMAAQPKRTPLKAKPEAKSEPKVLSKKKKERTKSPPNKKSKGKQEVEENLKHVRYAVEGELHRTMPTGATRGAKYEARAAYDNDVQAMQRTLESEYEVSLGRVCQHYKVCLAEETQVRREWGLALLLVTDVRAYSVQMVFRCGMKNAQSTAAARELFEDRYCSSSTRQVAISLIKRVSVYTNSVGAPDWPQDPS